MSIISGHVYYDQTNLLVPGIGIANVPVALFSPSGLVGAIALTDILGSFVFLNVPNGNYQVIEAWGTPGGTASPVNYAVSAVTMPVAPTEQEPPLSALAVVPPPMADKLNALTPNLINITATAAGVANLVFFDAPVGNKPLLLSGINMVGPNLITAANNGTFGSYPPGTAGTTIPPVAPYPAVTPGFTYATIPAPADGFYTIFNTTTSYATSPYWISSDHTTGLETGRFQFINGDNPGAAMFEQTVSVTPNTNYVLSAWVMNLINRQVGFADPSLGLQVRDQNGNIFISQSVNSIPPQLLAVWFQNGFLFNSGANNTLTVQIISLGPAARGNDYVIDDVAMFEAQFVDLLTQTKTLTPSTVYSQTGVGEPVTVTVNIQNPSTQTINNVFFQDVLSSYLQFIPGSVTVNASGVGFGTANPNIGFSLGNLAPGASKVVQFQTTTTGGPATVPNTASLSYDAITSATGDVIRATFQSNTANVDIVLNNAVVEIIKTVDKAFADTGDILTYTLTLNNTGNVSANNVTLTDIIPTGTTYVAGSLTGASGTFPNLTLSTPIPAGGSAIVTFQVSVGNTIPSPNPVTNSATAAFTFTVDPANPNGASGTAASNTASTQINKALLSTVKSVDLSSAAPGNTLTYTIIVSNSGNVAANNVIITDNIPTGTTFVPGSVTGASGTPPTLTIASIPAGGSATVTFSVTVNEIAQTPILNTAAVSYTYTINPITPNTGSGSTGSNPATTDINKARLVITKAASPSGVPYGGIITYTITLANTGNVAANNVIITDNLPTGTTFVPGSVTGASGTPPTLTVATIPAAGIAVVTFQVTVNSGTQSPVINSAFATFTFTANPLNPNGESGSATSNNPSTNINNAILAINKTADKYFCKPGDIITYTIVIQNIGNVSANNIIITDNIPVGTTFVAGSLTGATGTPPTFTLANSIPVGGSTTITFQVQVNTTSQSPIVNTADAQFTFTADPLNPNGATGFGSGSADPILVRYALVSVEKSVSLNFANIGDILTYTLTLTNTGNIAANNVVITDNVPVGTTFIPGSVTGASGIPPTLTVLSPISAGGTAIVTYKVTVDSNIPSTNLIVNTALANYSYTVDPALPNADKASANSNESKTQINHAKLVISKTTNMPISYIGAVISYKITVTNTGNVPANNVIITDSIPNATQFIPGSLSVNVPYIGTLNTGIALMGSILPAQTVVITFQVKVISMPVPNPIKNIATASFSYTVDPAVPNGVSSTTQSNIAYNKIFRYDYSQQINGLINSVALEQAALSAIINAEGAKIQKMVAIGAVDTDELLCINQSIDDMLNSISTLEGILKQKLSIVNCQIENNATGCK